MNFDIVVIGGGHAGVEAATVAARMNNQTCLITMSENDIGQLSCNPAIGGIGKGHLVREIDVFGGMIGKLADQSCIHFKMLNATKGEAVQGGRMQIDRELYQKASRHAIQNHKNLSCVFDEVIDIETHDNYLSIIAQTKTITAKKVIITTGTFLGGKLFLGDKTIEGGRLNDKPSNLLAQTITKTHKTLRLNTGTPPRIYHDTINYENLEQQLE
ncbi:MAG: FAD-dependent oxidoreductase, partial [Pseudomonadota bacterium]